MTHMTNAGGAALFAAYWWLLFPIFGFGIAFFSMWLRHRRMHAWLELMKTYAAQGKEPPANIAGLHGDPAGLRAEHWRDWERGRCGYRRSRYSELRRGIIFGVLSAAFLYLGHSNPTENGGFATTGVILGALSAAFLLLSLVPRSNPVDPPRTDGR